MQKRCRSLERQRGMRSPVIDGNVIKVGKHRKSAKYAEIFVRLSWYFCAVNERSLHQAQDEACSFF